MLGSGLYPLNPSYHNTEIRRLQIEEGVINKLRLEKA
jgi:hypothetical protein